MIKVFILICSMLIFLPWGDDWKGKFDFLKEEFPNLKIMYFPRGKISSSNIKQEIGRLYSSDDVGISKEKESEH